MSAFLIFLVTASVAFAAPALTYSTYLRDGFTPKAIAVDATGNIYLAGSAIVDPARAQSTVLVIKLNPQATQYLYVRYIGGSGSEVANAIAVDATGNLYIAGATVSPDFPVTTGGRQAAAPGPAAQRSFLVKLDAAGNIVFSTLLGGSASSIAQAVAVNASGQILVTGRATSNGFPSSTGANRVADTTNRPYLLALDAAGTTTVFSATGIGGSALTLDAAGNIYVAGSTSFLDYPTTAGVYQPQFPPSVICALTPCQIPSQAPNQYVTKLDPKGTTIVYSTAVSGIGSTTNKGLAVDASGSVYLTGLAGRGYPYSVTPPELPIGVGAIPALPFLTKLDPQGQKVLFSLPVGGAGVQVDARGSVYVAGITGGAGNYAVPSTISALSTFPARCLPDGVVARTSAYVTQLNGENGERISSSLIGGSGLALAGSALSNSTLWLAGETSLPDFPFTANPLTIPYFPSTPLPGAYLGAVDFNAPALAANAPQIACIVDAADMSPAGPMVRGQLLTAFGSHLSGAAITIGGMPAEVLYASDSQVNFAVPDVPASSPLQITANGVAGAERGLPLGFANPRVLLDLTRPAQPNTAFPSFALALNADGTLNGPDHPAVLGSTISVFVNGLQRGQVVTPQLASINGWTVLSMAAAGAYLQKVELRVPAALVNQFSCAAATGVCSVGFTLYDVAGNPGQPFGATVAVRR